MRCCRIARIVHGRVSRARKSLSDGRVATADGSRGFQPTATIITSLRDGSPRSPNGTKPDRFTDTTFSPTNPLSAGQSHPVFLILPAIHRAAITRTGVACPSGIASPRARGTGAGGAWGNGNWGGANRGDANRGDVARTRGSRTGDGRRRAASRIGTDAGVRTAGNHWPCAQHGTARGAIRCGGGGRTGHGNAADRPANGRIPVTCSSAGKLRRFEAGNLRQVCLLCMDWTPGAAVPASPASGLLSNCRRSCPKRSVPSAAWRSSAVWA